MLDFFGRVARWRRGPYDPKKKLKGSLWHISIVGSYFSNLSNTCDFPEMPCARFLNNHRVRDWDPQILASFKQQLKEIFVVPRLNNFHQTKNQINSFHLLEAFLTLLLQLLCHKIAHLVRPFQDRIDHLEKELRFLHTILGDISWMLLHSNELKAEFQNLLPEFEALANQAGSFVHYLFFSADPAFEEIEEGLDAVLNQTDLFKANLQSSLSMPAYTTPKTSIVDSILILDSLVDDLEDMIKQEDDRIADVKDQVNLLHQELLLSHSSIHEMKQPSEIEELKDPLMHIGGIAHQAQYLITAFLVKDAPLWYVFNRLTQLSLMIELGYWVMQIIFQVRQPGPLVQFVPY